MALVKKIFRNIVFPSIVSLGLEKMLSAFSGNKRLILCYHGCNPSPDFSLNGRHMPVNQFEKHLLYFKENFNVVSLDEIFRLYRESIIPDKKTIALTFDDGYLNNYTQVFPLLKKHNIPAAFFIVSSSLMDDNFILWPDIIDIIKAYSGKNSVEAAGITFKSKAGHGYYSDELKISLSDHIKKMGAEREAFMNELRSKTNFSELVKKVPVENYKFINASQVKSMSGSNLVGIGSHSHSHYNLGNIHSGLVKEEMTNSKRIIQETTGKEVMSVAFPDGSYNENVKKNCLEAGYKNLIGVSYQCASDSADPNILPRLTISNTTVFESNMIQVQMGFGGKGF